MLDLSFRDVDLEVEGFKASRHREGILLKSVRFDSEEGESMQVKQR